MVHQLAPQGWLRTVGAEALVDASGRYHAANTNIRQNRGPHILWQDRVSFMRQTGAYLAEFLGAFRAKAEVRKSTESSCSYNPAKYAAH